MKVTYNKSGEPIWGKGKIELALLPETRADHAFLTFMLDLYEDVNGHAEIEANNDKTVSIHIF